MEAGTVYGFSQVYSGANNQFYIKRHSNSATGSAVITLNRDDDNVTFAGTVGIGVAPAAGVSLDIREDSTTNVADFRNANASGFGLYVAGGSTASQYAFRAADKDNTALFSVMSDGNVGIGVAPQQLLHLKSDNPKVYLEDGNAGSDEKVYSIYPAGSQYVIETLADDYGAGQSAYVIDRTGTTVDEQKFYINNTAALTLGASQLATFAGIVETDKIFVAKGQNLSHGTSQLKLSQESTAKSQIRFYGADTSTAGSLEFMGSSSDGSAGAVRMTINADGDVGVGVTPAAKFHVKQTAANYIGHFEQSHANSYGVWIEEATGASAGYPLLQVTPEGGSNPYLRIDSGGLVAIGTTPQFNRELLVKGEIAAFASDSGDNQLLMAATSTQTNISATYGSSGSYVPMQFETGGAVRMTVDSTGNVKLGNSTTGTPAVNADDLVIDKGAAESGITIISTTASSLRFGDAANTSIGYIEYGHPNNNMNFGTNGSVAMQIDSNGRVSTGGGYGATNWQFLSKPSSGGTVDTNGGAGYFALGDGYTTSGAILMVRNDGDRGARGDANGSSLFKAEFNDGYTAMDINKDGTVLFAKTDVNVNTVGYRFDYDGQSYTSIATSNATHYVRDTTNTVYRFYVTGGGVIYATDTSISSISDVTLKENIKPLETGLDEILKLQPRRFDWKNGDGKNIAGFVAQEVEEVLPDLVSDGKYTEEETKKTLKMGDMIPTLVKAVQELKAEVDELKKNCNCK